MKRFVGSGALKPDLAYMGYISKINNNNLGSFFSGAQKFRSHLMAGRELMLQHFRTDNVEGSQDCLNRVFYCDMKTYLPEDILAVTDRMSMHHALEVRVPFLDHKLLEFCATIPRK